MPLNVRPTFRLFAAAVAAASWLGAALPAAGAATFIVFHSPAGNGDAQGGKPAAQPLVIPVGGSANVNAFLENYDPQGPGSADPAQICVSATTGHVCGWHVRFVGAGMRIDSFTPPTGPQNPIESNRASDGSALDVAGGSANGESGPVRIGTLRVTALASSGTLVAQSSFLDAAGAPRSPGSRVVAATLDACGNGVVNTPPEQCDDGNRTNGDGCFASCRSEFSILLSGTAQGGSVRLTLAQKTTLLAIPTIPGETAAALAGRVATVMSEDAELVAAGRSAQNVPTAKVATDAGVNGASSTDPGIQVQVVPEPGAQAGLFAGAALLGWLARRRRARAPASTAVSG